MFRCLPRENVCGTLLVHRDVEGIDRSEQLQFIRPTIFAGFGAISFAFVCQSSSFLVYRSMADKSVVRWRWVSRWAVSAALLMGLILALAGYGSFVNKTDANILNNFSTEHKAANVARGFLAVSMVRCHLISCLGFVFGLVIHGNVVHHFGKSSIKLEFRSM